MTSNPWGLILTEKVKSSVRVTDEIKSSLLWTRTNWIENIDYYLPLTIK